MTKLSITNEFIQYLIHCEKQVISSDRVDLYFENRSFRNNIKLISTDGKYKYNMAMRQSGSFIEDFSVLLMWTNANEILDIKKNIILLRCQGPHDGKQGIGSDLHHSYHTHEFDESDFTSKRFTLPSNRKAVNCFYSFEQAVIYFVKNCDIIGLDTHINMERFKHEQLKID